MESMKQIYLLLICQGFYLGSVCQRWTFPSRISAVFGSCVEVPCTYHPDGDSGTSNIIWYLYNNTNDLEILNTKDSSSVVDEYKGRTSLVPGENSCTLRIDPVRREDDGDIYYPGIAEDRNINAHKQNKAVLLNIDKVNIRLRGSMFLRKEGDATTIRCSVDHTCPSSPPSLKWNKPGQIKKRSVEISGGSWREESELKYFASYVDDGSRVLCTVIVPNGQNKSAASGPLNIQLDFWILDMLDSLNEQQKIANDYCIQQTTATIREVVYLLRSFEEATIFVNRDNCSISNQILK
ncbi:Schwann cell myelin protein-like [Leptodactylus fuscus]|uniref:Schwann cell myelin protein-like n=1 Tax=Leptodactylus fuscus TaxID=238119 RepID=UPI003F4EA20B